jgi:hypothetical protein
MITINPTKKENSLINPIKPSEFLHQNIPIKDTKKDRINKEKKRREMTLILDKKMLGKEAFLIDLRSLEIRRKPILIKMIPRKPLQKELSLSKGRTFGLVNPIRRPPPKKREAENDDQDFEEKGNQHDQEEKKDGGKVNWILLTNISDKGEM